MAERTLGINNLAPGFQYDVRVRGIFKGTPSEWGPVETIDVFSDTTSGTGDKAPNPPTSFTVTPTIDSFIIKWVAPTLNVDSTTLNDMKDYVLEVSDVTFGTADATYIIPEHQKPVDLSAVDRARQFEFTYKMNTELFGTPDASLFFRIYSRDATNNRSTPVLANATNAAPTAVGTPTATAAPGGVTISWPASASNDTVQYVVQSHTASMANPPVTGTEIYRGNGLNYFHAVSGALRYYRVGAVDIFGQTTWSAEVSATPGGAVPTYSTPNPPTVFTNAYVGANYRIGWTASVTPAVSDIAKYKVDVTANSVLKTFYTSDNFLDITPEMGKDYGTAWPYTPSVINVYSVGPTGLTSTALAGSGIVTAPVTPTAPTLTSTFNAGGVDISWAAPTDAKKILKEVQVYANTATTASPTNAAYAGDGTGFIYSVSPIFNGTYYFKSRVLDIFGRFSSYSAEDTEAVSSIGVPTSLTMSTALDPADTVNRKSIVTVNWTNPSTITFNGAKVRFRISTGLWTEINVGSMGGAGASASYNLRNLTPGATYEVQVASYDFKGSLGTWTAVTGTTIVAASDATAPSSTLSPTTSTGATSILVSWTGVNGATDPDTINANGRYDVQIATDTIFTTGLIKQVATTGLSVESMSAAFTGLTGGATYYARVRAVDWTGNAGSWNVYGGGTPTATVVGQGALVYSTPNNASAITDSWVGANYRITWTAATGTATDILKYKIDVLANAVTKTYYTTGLAIEIDPASGKTFGAAWPYTPTSITITTIGPTNLASTGVVKSTAFTAAPATPTAPTLTSAFNSSGIALSWSAVADPNAIIDGIEVYANTATTASPTNAVYSGIGTGFNYTVSPLFSGTYYFKSRVLDKFGRYSAYSAEDVEALVSVGLPTAMTLTSTLDEADLSNRTAKVAVAFTINNTTSYGGTKIRYKVSSTSTWTEVDLGSFGGAGAGAVTYYLRGLIPAAIYNVEIAHYSFAGVAGTWAVPASSPVTAASDATAPVSTLSPSATGGLTTIAVAWTGVNSGTNPTDADCLNGNGRYDIEIATDTVFTTGVIKKTMTTTASGQAMSTAFAGLTAGTTYYTRVRAVDSSGNAGSWNVYGGGTPTATVVGTVTVTYSTPNPPTVFTNAYVGSSYRIGWTASTTPAVSDIAKYRVDITANAVSKSFFTTDVFVDIDPSMGRDFGAAWPYTPSVINVYSIGPSGLVSSALAGSGIVTAPTTPAAPTLASTINSGGIAVTWTPPTDTNGIVKEVQVYANTATTASPTNAVYSGNGGAFTYSISPIFNGTYYFKSRVLDIFGRFSGYSAEDSEVVTSIGVPSALSTSSALDPADTVNSTSIITVNWTNPATVTYNGSKIRYRITAGLWTEVDVGSMGGISAAASYNLRNLEPGSSYIVEVAAYDFKGSLGTWTAAGTQVAASDSTAPSSTLSPTTSTGATSVLVSWTGVNTTTDKDALNGNGRYDVELNTSSTFIGTAVKQTSPTGASLEPMSAAFTGLAGGTTYYARVRAVDWTGNVGSWNVYGGGTPTATVVGAGALVYSTPNNASAITDSWVGANYRITWTAATGTATDILKYKIDVLANAVTKTFYTTGLAIEIDPASGKTFGTAWPYTPTSITITTIGPTNLASTGVVKSAAFTAAPATPTAPTLTSTFNVSGIALSWAAVSDPNAIIDGIEVYANTATTASPTNAVYSGIGTGFNYSVSPLFSGTYYFKSRVLDKFGRYSAYSAEDTEALVSVGVPSAGSLTASLDPADPTNRTSMLAVNFTIANTLVYGGSRLRYRIGAGAWTEIDIGAMGAAGAAVTYNLRSLIPGATYIVDVAHYTFNRALGTWTNIGTQLTTADATAPVSTLSPTATGSTTAISVNWTGVNTGTNPGDADCINGNGRYDIEIATDTVFTTGVIRKVMTTGASAVAMSTAFAGLTAGATYYTRVRATDVTGNVGSWNVYGGGTPTATTVGAVTPVYSTPNAPTSMVDSWVGANYRIAWTASSGPATTDIEMYRVVLVANAITRTYYTADVSFDVTPTLGAEFGAAWPYTPTSINVYTHGPSGLISSALNKVASFAAGPSIPAAPTIATPVLDAGGIYISWPAVSGATGYEIYGVGTGSTTVIYSGDATFFRYALPSVYSGTYYFRGKSKDIYGRLTAAYGAEVSIVATSTLTAPTSSVAIAFDSGDVRKLTSEITVSSISGPSSPILAGFKLRYKKSGDTNWTEVDVNKSATTYIIRGLAVGVAYNVEMASYDVMGRVSATWVAATGSPVTMAADSVAPTTPTTPTGSSNTMNIQITQPITANVSDGDVKEYEVHASITNAFTPSAATLIGKIPYTPGGSSVSTFQIPTTGGTATQTWYVKTKAVDWTGNISAASAQLTTTPGLIANANIIDATIQSAKIGSVDATTITVNQLTSAQINAAGITADKIQLGGNGRNLLPAQYADFENNNDGSFWVDKFTTTNVTATIGSGAGNFNTGLQALSANVTSTTTPSVYLAETATTYNIQIKPRAVTGTKYIVSAWMKAASGTPSVTMRMTGNVSGANNSTAIPISTTWTRYSFLFTMGTTDSSANLAFTTFTATGVYLIDSVMVEEQVGNQTTPSTFDTWGGTVIDGDSITTGSLATNRIALGLFGSNQIENGSFEDTGVYPRVKQRVPAVLTNSGTIPGWTTARIGGDTTAFHALEWGDYSNNKNLLINPYFNADQASATTPLASTGWALYTSGTVTPAAYIESTTTTPGEINRILKKENLGSTKRTVTLEYPVWFSTSDRFDVTNLTNYTGTTLTPVYPTCSLTVATDLATSVGHGLTDGTTVKFPTVTTTTGIGTSTLYYVINATTDTFQISTTDGGSVVDMTGSNGSATYQVQGPSVKISYTGGALADDTGSLATPNGYLSYGRVQRLNPTAMASGAVYGISQSVTLTGGSTQPLAANVKYNISSLTTANLRLRLYGMYAISSVTVSGTNLVTITTRTPHGLSGSVDIEGVYQNDDIGSLSFSGTKTVTSTGTYTFTYATTGATNATWEPGGAAVIATGSLVESAALSTTGSWQTSPTVTFTPNGNYTSVKVSIAVVSTGATGAMNVFVDTATITTGTTPVDTALVTTQRARSGLSKAVLGKSSTTTTHGTSLTSDGVSVLQGNKYHLGFYYYGDINQNITVAFEWDDNGAFSSPTVTTPTGGTITLSETLTPKDAISAGFNWDATTSGYLRVVVKNTGTAEQGIIYIEDVWLTVIGQTSGELTDAGIRLFDENGLETVSLMADSSESGDFLKLGSTLRLDGATSTISADTGNFGLDTLVGGTSLAGYLSDAGAGIIARANRSSNQDFTNADVPHANWSGGIAYNSGVPYLELSVDNMDAARDYRITVGPCRMYNTNGNGTLADFMLGYRFNATTIPALPRQDTAGGLDDVIMRMRMGKQASQNVTMGQVTRVFNPPTSGNYRFLLYGGSDVLGPAASIRFDGNAASPTQILVEDLGAEVASSGVVRAASASDVDTRKITKTAIVPVKWVGVYNGDGALIQSIFPNGGYTGYWTIGGYLSTYPNQKIVYGFDPPLSSTDAKAIYPDTGGTTVEVTSVKVKGSAGTALSNPLVRFGAGTTAAYPFATFAAVTGKTPTQYPAYAVRNGAFTADITGIGDNELWASTNTTSRYRNVIVSSDAYDGDVSINVTSLQVTYTVLE